jgi:SPX domain protein involved in polyphosphate accumulation
MKFSAQFEFHKIPEWYSEYMDYKRLKAMIKRFKGKVSSKL